MHNNTRQKCTTEKIQLQLYIQTAWEWRAECGDELGAILC